MKTPSKGLVFFGIVFLVWGLLWTLAISYRDTRAQKKSVVTAYRELPRVIEKTIEKHVHEGVVKAHHIVLFWVLAGMEMLAAALYIFAGIACLRVYSPGAGAVVGAVCFDVLYKLSVISYMKWIALPIQELIQKPNLLRSYYVPTQNTWAVFSEYSSGLKIFGPGGVAYALVCAAAAVVVVGFFTRPKIKEQFRRAGPA